MEETVAGPGCRPPGTYGGAGPRSRDRGPDLPPGQPGWTPTTAVRSDRRGRAHPVRCIRFDRGDRGIPRSRRPGGWWPSHRSRAVPARSGPRWREWRSAPAAPQSRLARWCRARSFNALVGAPCPNESGRKEHGSVNTLVVEAIPLNPSRFPYPVARYPCGLGAGVEVGGLPVGGGRWAVGPFRLAR